MTRGLPWKQVDIVVDSPLAADFAAGYVRLREHWDREARRKLTQGRHPLAFEQVTTIADHATHQPKQAQAALLRQRHRGVEVVVP